MAPKIPPRAPIRTFILLSSFLFISPSSAALTSQFQHFYPQHGDKYEFILRNNCTQQYANYLTGRLRDFPLDWIGGGGPSTVLVQPVVKCLLDNASEYIKSASASAQVLLGVTPPILATLGATTDELAMLNVIGRRPLFALLISIGSPSVYIDRLFDYREPAKIMRHTKGRYHPYKPKSSFQRWSLVTLQYAIAALAAANIALLNWQLGLGTVCCWWAQTVFGPLVWGILSIPIHFAGVFALRLRVRRIQSDKDKELRIGAAQWFRLVPTRLYNFCKSEWVPAVSQDAVRLVDFDERKISVAWAWFLSTSTIIHLIFGSLLLSGLLFIGPQDALLVIFRYVASVVVCRLLVIFELAGMRENYNSKPNENDPVHMMELDNRANSLD
ncbi:hypothetical protein F5Y19DRAFT_411682 [Xylariaceae sp. FL1651]|nr:hypothetical protein F5Y19DRAFT_411682 [Xylariaceae sp. FL1651]